MLNAEKILNILQKKIKYTAENMKYNEKIIILMQKDKQIY